MNDIFSKTKRSEIMSKIRSKNTRPEKKIRSLLHQKGFRFKLHEKSLPGKPDIVLPKWNSIIEIRGCFWHPHKGCKLFKMPSTNRNFWTEKFKKNINRDRVNDKKIKKLGWRLFILRECQTKNKENLLKTFTRLHNQLLSKK